ncbi:hypothetical protein ACIQ6Y_24690 [Streptomyces sp. NPDC096205]|uniref:hypothetical protein n=1 Tax=Streptomyces sp. NPDC096205 TaxID=3366081 RepID=UPI003812D745
MRIGAKLAGLALAAGAVAVTTTPASAYEFDNYKDGYCVAQELCMYYHSAGYSSSSMMDYFDEEPTHHDDRFLASGPGQGQVVGNNASSAKCWGTRYNYAIFFNSNFTGQRHNHTCDGVRRDTPGWLQNNNASSYEPF